MSVWCLNVHLDLSKRQTAVRTLRPLLPPYQQLLSRRIWGILEAQTFRQHPKRQGEKPTHAAVQTLTNILILVSVWTHKSEKWITDAAAKKQTWNTGRHLTAMCEAELGDPFCTVNSITWTANIFLLSDLLCGVQVPPSKMSCVCCLRSISPSKELRFSSRPRCFDEKMHLRESQRLSQGPWLPPLQRKNTWRAG